MKRITILFLLFFCIGRGFAQSVPVYMKPKFMATNTVADSFAIKLVGSRPASPYYRNYGWIVYDGVHGYLHIWNGTDFDSIPRIQMLRTLFASNAIIGGKIDSITKSGLNFYSWRSGIATLFGKDSVGAGGGGGGISADPTAKRINFGNGSNLVGDDALSWDNTNKRFSIGWLTPTAQLSIKSAVGTSVDIINIYKADGTTKQFQIQANESANTLDLMGTSGQATLRFTTSNINSLFPFTSREAIFKGYASSGGIPITISSFSGQSVNLFNVNSSTGTGDLFTILGVGNVGIKKINPTAELHLGAGGTAAGSAPFKFTLGTSVLLTTPEAGALEADNTRPYFTNSSGARNSLAFLTDITGGSGLDPTHPTSTGSTPTVSSSAGTGVISSITVSGHDAAMTLTFTVAAGNTINGAVCTITYASAWGTAPVPVFSAGDVYTGVIGMTAPNTTTISVNGSNLSAGTYIYKIHSIQ